MGLAININARKVGQPKTLREIKGDDRTVFTHDVLERMRDGEIDERHPIFGILHHVKDILHQNEAYDSFSEFMRKLKTDANSLQNPDNYIRRVYEDFRNGKPQQWKLIDPDEYQQFFQSDEFDACRQAQITGWIADAKDNAAQLAANSYLTSGPALDPRVKNSKGELTFYRLWHDLAGDEKITFFSENRNDRHFDRTYWNPFVEYIGTDFGDSEEGAGAFETDSPLDGFFNIIAEFEKNPSDFKKMFAALDKLINIRHNRGRFIHLFMRGGSDACSKIAADNQLTS